MNLGWTQYGFKWGPLEVERAVSDDKKGWVVVALKTAKHEEGISVYVTKTGKLRIFSGEREWGHPE